MSEGSHTTHDGHDHAAGDGHSHDHARKDFGPAFAIGTSLNIGFVGVEVVYGLLSNSMALVADAGHNLGDVLGLLMAWIASVLARRAPSQTHTYGLRGGAQYWRRLPMRCCCVLLSGQSRWKGCVDCCIQSRSPA